MVARNFEFETFEKGIDCVTLLFELYYWYHGTNYHNHTMVRMYSIRLLTLFNPCSSMVQVGREIHPIKISALNSVVNLH